MNKKVLVIVITVLIIVVATYMFISINSNETMLSVTSASTLKNGDFLTVVLKDNYRNAYPDQVIDVKILDDSGWAHHFNATTDEKGQANILIQGMENGNYTVHSQFNGTLFLHPSKSVNSLEINDGMN